MDGETEMAQSLKKQIAAARKRVDRLMDEIFAYGPNSNTLFSVCLKLAPVELVETLETTRGQVYDLESEAVRSGKAYRTSYSLQFYR